MPDPGSYLEKKRFFSSMLTVYGRKPVLETLRNEQLDCHALHLARSNRQDGIVREIRSTAQARGLEVREHSRDELARISKNGKQDQGVALDVRCPSFRQLDEYLANLSPGANLRLLALDGISNPQNLGMIIRSAAAGRIDGIVLPARGNAALGPLAIKASAGTLFHAPLLLCDDLGEALRACKDSGASICTLASGARDTLFQRTEKGVCVYVLGNETEGVSGEAREMSDAELAIPMNNGVESLNVAVTASLVAFAPYFER